MHADRTNGVDTASQLLTVLSHIVNYRCPPGRAGRTFPRGSPSHLHGDKRLRRVPLATCQAARHSEKNPATGATRQGYMDSPDLLHVLSINLPPPPPPQAPTQRMGFNGQVIYKRDSTSLGFHLRLAWPTLINPLPGIRPPYSYCIMNHVYKHTVDGMWYSNNTSALRLGPISTSSILAPVLCS